MKSVCPFIITTTTILTKYHSKNLGSNPWDIREKKMFCPSCLCNFCPAECPHLVRALYYLWPINRVLYFFKVIEVRYACFWGNNLSILYVEETFSYFKRYFIEKSACLSSCKVLKKSNRLLNFPTFMINMSKTKSDHYFINRIHQKFE